MATTPRHTMKAVLRRGIVRRVRDTMCTGTSENLEIPDRRFRAVRNDCREWEAVFVSLLRCTMAAFTTLLTGNGLSAATSVKVRENHKSFREARLLRHSRAALCGRKHA